MPTKNLEALSCNVCPKAGYQSVCKVTSMPLIIYGWADVQCVSPDLPGLPPPYLHTASDQRLEAGMAWEQG